MNCFRRLSCEENATVNIAIFVNSIHAACIFQNITMHYMIDMYSLCWNVPIPDGVHPDPVGGNEGWLAAHHGVGRQWRHGGDRWRGGWRRVGWQWRCGGRVVVFILELEHPFRHINHLKSGVPSDRSISKYSWAFLPCSIKMFTFRIGISGMNSEWTWTSCVTVTVHFRLWRLMGSG